MGVGKLKKHWCSSYCTKEFHLKMKTDWEKPKDDDNSPQKNIISKLTRQFSWEWERERERNTRPGREHQKNYQPSPIQTVEKPSETGILPTMAWMGIRVGGRTSGSEIRSNRQSSPPPHIHGKKQNKPKRKKKQDSSRTNVKLVQKTVTQPHDPSHDMCCWKNRNG